MITKQMWKVWKGEAIRMNQTGRHCWTVGLSLWSMLNTEHSEIPGLHDYNSCFNSGNLISWVSGYVSIVMVQFCSIMGPHIQWWCFCRLFFALGPTFVCYRGEEGQRKGYSDRQYADRYVSLEILWQPQLPCALGGFFSSTVPWLLAWQNKGLG